MGKESIIPERSKLEIYEDTAQANRQRLSGLIGYACYGRYQEDGWYILPCNCNDRCKASDYYLIKDDKVLISIDTIFGLSNDEMKRFEKQYGF